MSERIYQAIIGVLVIVVLVEGWWIIRAQGAASEMAMQMQTSQTSTSTGTSMGDMNATTSAASTTTWSATTTQVTAGADSVSIANQAAGMSVMVSSVTVGQPTWIAVRDSSGRTLGAGLVATGTATDVSVPLLRATTAGQSYQVLLYADNGDRQFELDQDVLIQNADGSVAGTTFSAQ